MQEKQPAASAAKQARALDPPGKQPAAPAKQAASSQGALPKPPASLAGLPVKAGGTAAAPAQHLAAAPAVDATKKADVSTLKARLVALKEKAAALEELSARRETARHLERATMTASEPDKLISKPGEINGKTREGVRSGSSPPPAKESVVFLSESDAEESGPAEFGVPSVPNGLDHAEDEDDMDDMDLMASLQSALGKQQSGIPANDLAESQDEASEDEVEEQSEAKTAPRNGAEDRSALVSEPEAQAECVAEQVQRPEGECGNFGEVEAEEACEAEAEMEQAGVHAEDVPINEEHTAFLPEGEVEILLESDEEEDEEYDPFSTEPAAT